MKTLKKIRRKIQLYFWFKEPPNPLKEEFKPFFSEAKVILSAKRREALYLMIGKN